MRNSEGKVKPLHAICLDFALQNIVPILVRSGMASTCWTQAPAKSFHSHLSFCLPTTQCTVSFLQIMKVYQRKLTFLTVAQLASDRARVYTRHTLQPMPFLPNHASLRPGNPWSLSCVWQIHTNRHKGNLVSSSLWKTTLLDICKATYMCEETTS